MFPFDSIPKMRKDANVLFCIHSYYTTVFFFLSRCGRTRAMDISGRGSAGRRDLYLTTHDTQNRQTSMPPARCAATIRASKRSQICDLHRAATGTGIPPVSDQRIPETFRTYYVYNDPTINNLYHCFIFVCLSFALWLINFTI